MNHPEGREIEIKLRIPSPEGLGARLSALGFALVHPDQEERSVLWDQGGRMVLQGCALRLRRYGGQVLLTWKGPREADPLLKIRPEVETRVEDGDAMEAILRALGFRPALAMVKRRALWRRGDLEACVDTAPFGAFLELEGSREAIREAMGELGLDEALAEGRSYAALFREYDDGSMEGRGT